MVVPRPDDEVTPAEAARILGVTPQFVDRFDRRRGSALPSAAGELSPAPPRFPDPLNHHGVAVMSADEFLSRLLRCRPTAVVETIRRVAAEKRRPSLTPCDVAERLARRLGCDDTP